MPETRPSAISPFPPCCHDAADDVLDDSAEHGCCGCQGHGGEVLFGHGSGKATVLHANFDADGASNRFGIFQQLCQTIKKSSN